MKTYPSDDGKAAFIRLVRGEDLLRGLTDAVTSLGIRAGTVQAIGAVSKLVVGYYDQSAKEYRTHTVDEPLEIASGLGNVSEKDGTPFVHLHVIATREDGSTVGGHLMDGTVVFIAECYVRALDGPTLVREPDDDTGLTLWR